MAIETLSLQDLSAPIQQNAFEAFVQIYMQAFPDPNQREDPAKWEKRIAASNRTAASNSDPSSLGAPSRENQTSSGSSVSSGDSKLGSTGYSHTRLIVSGRNLGDPEQTIVTGGIVTEFYLQSQTGLISYIAVDSGARDQGHARALAEAAKRGFYETAQAFGKELRGVFAEAEDPRRAADLRERLASHRRLQILAHFGARWIDVPYAQPPLDPSKEPVELLLLAIPEMSGHAVVFPIAAVTGFLGDYYGALDADKNALMVKRHADIRRRLVALATESELGSGKVGLHKKNLHKNDEAAETLLAKGAIILREPPSPETPHLQLKRLSIALHAVSVESSAAPDLTAPETVPPPGMLGGKRPEFSDNETAAEWAHALGSSYEKARTRARIQIEDDAVWGRIGATEPLTLAGATPRTYCPIFNSFERDILAYRFLSAPPVVSVCASERPVAIELHFPDHTDFLAEGEAVTWIGGRTPVPAMLQLSFSRFPESGVRVWHVALRPAEGDVFTELDLVKLVTLYDGSQEDSNVPAELRMALPGGPPVPPAHLLYYLSGGALVGATFRGGTIEIDLSEHDSPVPWERLLECVNASSRGTGATKELLRGFMMESPDGRKALLAYSGIIQGIFGYERMSAGELAEMFRPQLMASNGARWKSISCGTLLDLDTGNAMLGVTARTMGLTPYLAIPHAAALHNEFVTDVAETHLDATKAATDVRTLQQASGAAERLLRRFTVPNVFLYASERELYERLLDHRGAAHKRTETESKLLELKHRLERAQSYAADRRAYAVTVFLGLLSLTALLDVIAFLEGHDLRAFALSTGGAIVAAGLALLAMLYVVARPKR